VSDNKSSSDQLPLDLPLKPGLTRDDLIVGEANRLAVEMIDNWPDWSAPLVILAGPPGSGKSHIAAVWAAKTEAWIMEADKLVETSLEKLPATNFVIENIAEGKIYETGLFHLINDTREKGGFGLLTSTQWPRSWNITLPDLASRLRSAILVEIKEPDDVLLRQTLIKLFADRQISVESTVVDYLVIRMERSIATAARIVELLDREALARGKPITRPMAARILEMMQG